MTSIIYERHEAREAAEHWVKSLGLEDGAYLNRYPDEAHFTALSDHLLVRLTWLQEGELIADTTLYTEFDAWKPDILPANVDVDTDDRGWEYWQEVLSFLQRTSGILRVEPQDKSLELTDGTNLLSLPGKVEDEIVLKSEGWTPQRRYDVANAYTEATTALPETLTIYPYRNSIDFIWTTVHQDITARRHVTLNRKETQQ